MHTYLFFKLQASVKFQHVPNLTLKSKTKQQFCGILLMPFSRRQCTSMEQVNDYFKKQSFRCPCLLHISKFLVYLSPWTDCWYMYIRLYIKYWAPPDNYHLAVQSYSIVKRERMGSRLLQCRCVVYIFMCVCVKGYIMKYRYRVEMVLEMFQLSSKSCIHFLTSVSHKILRNLRYCN